MHSNFNYFKSSFHEMGIYDLSAIIEMVTETTGNNAMFYVGHSMGTAMLAVLLSTRPEYNTRTLTGFLLSPAIQFGRTAPQLKFFTRGSNYFQVGQIEHFINCCLIGEYKLVFPCFSIFSINFSKENTKGTKSLKNIREKGQNIFARKNEMLVVCKICMQILLYNIQYVIQTFLTYM